MAPGTVTEHARVCQQLSHCRINTRKAPAPFSRQLHGCDKTSCPTAQAGRAAALPGPPRNQQPQANSRGWCQSHPPGDVSQGSPCSEPGLQHSRCLVQKDSRALLQSTARPTGCEASPVSSTCHRARATQLCSQPQSGVGHPPAHLCTPQPLAAGWPAGILQCHRPSGYLLPSTDQLMPPVPPHHHPAIALSIPSAAPSPAPKVSPGQRCRQGVPDASCPVHALGLRENGALRQSPVSLDHPSTVSVAQADPEAPPSHQDRTQQAGHLLCCSALSTGWCTQRLTYFSLIVCQLV